MNGNVRNSLTEKQQQKKPPRYLNTLEVCARYNKYTYINILHI